MFSEKYGYKPERTILFEAASPALQQRIWNLFYHHEVKINDHKFSPLFDGDKSIADEVADRLGYSIQPTKKGLPVSDVLRQHVLDAGHWYDIYDFIEIYLSFLDADTAKERADEFNEIFEQEKAGYRVICGEIAPITNGAEIGSIEQAAATPFQSVNQHIQKALTHYADLRQPDYENSIKESISAVEAMCCIITNSDKATLGQALKRMEEADIIHKAMASAFSALYGYTSDETGIRHGGIDFKNAPAEDAKYMLVSCSAFVNYLAEKVGKSEELLQKG